MSNITDKIYDEIQRNIKINKDKDVVVLLGKSEYSELQTIPTALERDRIFGYRCKMLYIDSLIQIVNEKSYNMILDYHKHELLENMNKCRTLMRDT